VLDQLALSACPKPAQLSIFRHQLVHRPAKLAVALLGLLRSVLRQ
jgi:hypothetical protein